jgi:hypothetical protein
LDIMRIWWNFFMIIHRSNGSLEASVLAQLAYPFISPNSPYLTGR